MLNYRLEDIFMPEIQYKNIPTLSKWQSDSSVTFATRKDDRILTHIDFLVERYHYHVRGGNGAIQITIVSDLFFTVSVRPSASFQEAQGFDAVGVWTNNNNDQGGGEAVRRPTGWPPSVKRANSANGNSASSAGCR